MPRAAGLHWVVSALALVMWSVEPAFARADDTEVVQKRADLLDVQRRIQELEKAIAETETTRSVSADKLAAAERAVSAASRQLRELATERAASEQNLATQVAEQQVVEARIAQRQVELAGWLKRHYLHGGSDMAPFLSGREPNQLARDAYYLEQLGKARLALIESLRNDLREQARLVASIAERRDALVALEAEQGRQRGELQKVQAARARALAGVARKIEGQQQQVKTLRHDEQQLAELVTVLARQAVERELARRDAAQRAAAQRAAVKPVPPPVSTQPPVPTPRPHGGNRSEPVVGEVRQLAGAAPAGVRFAQLRGKMGFPVRGELVGQFGAQRAEGGTRWRGVFIRARNGEDVVSVASGEVVFSDWLRGYGNLIIVDHGDDYLTIYGNNDALFRVVGERIGGGVPIASVGASGGAQESGLYFEIRHKGEPVDPLKWVRNR